MHLKGCLTVLNTCVDWFGYCCSKFDRMGGGGVKPIDSTATRYHASLVHHTAHHIHHTPPYAQHAFTLYDWSFAAP